MHAKRVLALILMTTLALSAVTLAAAAAADQSETADHAVSTDPRLSADNPMGSIGVHGHWEIEVRNPDGSLAAMREFDNALFDTGAFILGNFLSGTFTPASWIVFFNGAPTPCEPLTGESQQWCFIVESRVPATASSRGISKNLVVTTDPLKLSGSITLPKPGSITTVQSIHDYCGHLLAPSSCISESPVSAASTKPANLATRSLWFTGTSIAPINVLAGQLVTVTITFTFSSAP
jgi:hypothetical protein